MRLHYAVEANGALDARIETRGLSGRAEVEELREALEMLQNLSLEVGEQLDLYQYRHAH